MDLITIKKFLKKSKCVDRFLIGLVLFGAIVSVISVFRGILMDRQVQVEYLDGGVGSELAKGKIFIDIEGAVISPGVYELPVGSRVKDVLVLAGGLAEDADRLFCEKNINLAEEIKDGQKIYIPSAVNTNAQQGYFEASIQSNKVSINSASVAELDTLWGVGDTRAGDIVKNRPYQSVDELVSKGVLTKTIVDKNRERLSVY